MISIENLIWSAGFITILSTLSTIGVFIGWLVSSYPGKKNFNIIYPPKQFGYEPIDIIRIGNYAVIVFPVKYTNDNRVIKRLHKKYNTVRFGDDIFDMCGAVSIKTYYPINETEVNHQENGYKDCSITVFRYHIRGIEPNDRMLSNISQLYVNKNGGGFHYYLDLNIQNVIKSMNDEEDSDCNDR